MFYDDVDLFFFDFGGNEIFEVGDVLAVDFVVTFYVGDRDGYITTGGQFVLRLDFVLFTYLFVFLDDGGGKFDGTLQGGRRCRRLHHGAQLFVAFDFGFGQFGQRGYLVYNDFIFSFGCDELYQHRERDNQNHGDNHDEGGHVVTFGGVETHVIGTVRFVTIFENQFTPIFRS